MKKLFFLITASVLFLSFASFAQTIQVISLESYSYQIKFTELTQQGYRPIKVEAKKQQVIDYQPGEVPRLGYTATFSKIPNSAPWVARHGLTSAQYQQEFTKWTNQGYMPTDINVASLDGVISYSVIFDKLTTHPAWEARHGLNASSFAKIDKELTQKGYKIKIKTSAGYVFAALWVK